MILLPAEPVVVFLKRNAAVVAPVAVCRVI
jgi:hypothetical protein